MLSPAVLSFIVWFSICSSALIAVVWLMTLCGRSAAQRHFCWCCGLVGVFALPVLGLIGPEIPVDLRVVPSDLGNVLAATDLGTGSIQLPVSYANADVDFEPPIVSGSRQEVAAESSSSQGSVPVASEESLATVDWKTAEELPNLPAGFELNLPTITVLVWMLVVMLGFAFLVKDLAYLRKLRRQSTEVTSHPAVSQLAQAVGLGAGVQVMANSECRMPMTWGMSSPVILLPKEFSDWSQSRLKTVLSHEAAHIARHDWAWQFLARLTSLLAWFHPLVLFAAIRLHKESEKAVDDRLLASGIEASAYAEVLMFFAHLGQQRQRVVLSMAVSPVESRIRHILCPTRTRSRLSAVAAALILVVAFSSVVAIAGLRSPAKSHQGRDAIAPENDNEGADDKVLEEVPGQVEIAKPPVAADSVAANIESSAVVGAQESVRLESKSELAPARPSLVEIAAAMQQKDVLPDLWISYRGLDVLKNHFGRVLNLAGPDAVRQQRNVTDMIDLIFYGVHPQKPVAVQFTDHDHVNIHAPIGKRNALIDDNLGSNYQLQPIGMDQFRAVDEEAVWVVVADSYATISFAKDLDQPPMTVSEVKLKGDVEFKFRNQRSDLVAQAARENFFFQKFRSSAVDSNMSLPLKSLILLCQVYAEHIYSEASSASFHSTEVANNVGRVAAIPGSSLDATFSRMAQQRESRLQNVAFNVDSTVCLHFDYPMDKWHQQFASTIGQLVLLNFDTELNEVGSQEKDPLADFAEQLVGLVATPGDRLTGFLNVYGSPEASTTVLGIQADSTAVQLLLQKAESSGVFDSVQKEASVAEASLYSLAYSRNEQTFEFFVGIDDELVWVGLGPDARDGLPKAIKASIGPPRATLAIQAQVHVPRLLSILNIAKTPVSITDNSSGWAKLTVESSRPSEATASLLLDEGVLAVMGHVVAEYCRVTLD